MHLGVGQRLQDDTAWATLWFTVLFAPIVPLGRERLRFFPHRGTGYSVQVVEKSPLVLGEIIGVYAFSLLLVPLALGMPLWAIIRENWESLGLSSGTPHNLAIGAWIAWLVAWVIGLFEWHERRFKPGKGSK